MSPDLTGAIDAAVEAVKAAAVASAAATTNDAVWQLNDDTEYFNMSGIYSENVPELVRIAVEAAAPILQHHHFGEFMAEIFTPIVKEHLHPPETCPCCQLYLAAQQAESLTTKGQS